MNSQRFIMDIHFFLKDIMPNNNLRNTVLKIESVICTVLQFIWNIFSIAQQLEKKISPGNNLE